MHSTLSSTLSSPPVITFVVGKGGGHGHCHQMGCWVSWCVIWKAKCQISGFVWSWNYSISMLMHPEKDIRDDSEAVAFPPPCTSGVPKWGKDAVVFGYGQCSRTNSDERYWIYGWFRVDNWMHRRETDTECLLLRLWLWYDGKQCASIRSRWESIFLCDQLSRLLGMEL